MALRPASLSKADIAARANASLQQQQQQRHVHNLCYVSASADNVTWPLSCCSMATNSSCAANPEPSRQQCRPIASMLICACLPSTTSLTPVILTSLTLQGIALSANPNYKVLGAAYPWIARRLLLDTAPELQETLRTLLYKVLHIDLNNSECLPLMPLSIYAGGGVAVQRRGLNNNDMIASTRLTTDQRPPHGRSQSRAAAGY